MTDFTRRPGDGPPAAVPASTDRLRELLDRLPGMVGYWDARLRNVLANHAYLEWFGLTPEQITGRHFREVLGEELYALNEPYALAALAGEPQTFDRTIVDAGGRIRHTQSAYVPDVSGGQVHGFQVLITDITARKIAESARADESEMLRTILNTVSDAVICLDHELRVVDLNAAAVAITGWALGDAVDRPVEAVLRVTNHVRSVGVRRLCQEVLHTQIPRTRPDTDRLHDRQGRETSIDWSITPLRSSGGELRGLVLTLRDVHGSRELLRDTQRRAEQDPLTGLKNRSYLAGYGRQRRSANQVLSAVVFLDLDGFKAVNDSSGHVAGDAVLRDVASVIAQSVRRTDDVIRMGGDEFAVLLRACTVTDALAVADKIVSQVEVHEFRWRDSAFRLGVSAGVARAGGADQRTLEQALELADGACYRAKRSGGHRAVLADDLADDLPEVPAQVPEARRYRG